jgi:small-conductance mechanosensitive channel
MRQHFLIFFFGALLWAQVEGQTTNAPAAASGTNAASATTPETITLGDVVNQADLAEATLRELQASLATDKTVQTVDESLPPLTHQIDSRQADTAKLLANNPSLSALRSAHSGWQLLADQLDTLKQSLTDRITQLDQQVGTLNQQTKTWQTVLALTKTSVVPPEIVARIKTTLTAIGQATKATEALRARILSAQTRVSEQDTRISSALADVAQAQQNAVTELFTRDSEPLWSLDLQAERTSAVTTGQATLLAQLTEVRAYVSEKLTTVVVHLGIFMLLACLLFWLRRETLVRAKDEPAWQHTAQVFDVPVATAALLALLISHRLYEVAPRLFWAGIGAAIMIPAVIVLRRLIASSLVPILYAMVLSYVADQLRYVNVASEIIERLLFLGEAAAVGLFLLGLIRSQGLAAARLKDDRLARTIRIYAHAAFFVFIFAGFANVLGYVRLSNLAGNGVLESSYLAVILYAAVRIADGLVMTALRIRPLKLLGAVQRHHALLAQNLSRYLRWLAFGAWVALSLELFSLRAPLWASLKSILTATLPIDSLPISLGSVLAFGITVWVSFLLSRFIRFILEEEVYGHFTLASGVPYAISTMVHYAVLLLGFYIALAALKVNVTQFTVLAGAFGVGLGFGLQTIMNNFVSGIILLFERPIKLGDVIQLDATNIGVVERIGIRASIIRANSGAEIIVPNGSLISGQVINWTLSNGQRVVEIPVTVSSKADPARVIALLLEAAQAHPLVIKETPPQALLDTFTATTLTFQLRAWTDSYNQWQKVRSDLSMAINAALVKENIPLA